MYIGLIYAAVHPEGCDGGDCVPSSIMLLRLLRLLRLLKMAKHYDGSTVLVEALRRSMSPLLIPLFFLFLQTFAFAGAVYYTEGVIGGSSDFDNIFKAAWFVLVTLTTVGYGDVVPSSTVGQLVSVVAIVCGVLFMAMPISIVGNEFTNVWAERELLQVTRSVQMLLKERNLTPAEVALVFREFDQDAGEDASLDQTEFGKALEVMGLHLSRSRVRHVFNAFDKDGDGFVECATSRVCA